MEEDIRTLIKLLDTSSYACLLDYILIPNKPDIFVNVYLLLEQHGEKKVNFVSEALEMIRVKHDVTYDTIQSTVRNIIE